MSNAMLRLAALAAVFPALGGETVAGAELPNFRPIRDPVATAFKRRARRVSAKPRPIHKSLTLTRFYGPGSYAEHDHLVAKVGAVGAREVERRGPAHVAACLADPWKYMNEPRSRPPQGAA